MIIVVVVVVCCWMSTSIRDNRHVFFC